MLTLAFVAFAILLAVLEARKPTEDRDFWRAEMRTSACLAVGAATMQWLSPDLAGFGVVSQTASPSVIAAVLLADDFLYYASHRLAHGVGFFWATHAVHHSGKHFNFFVGLRQPVTWLLTPAALAPVLLVVAGAPLDLVALSGVIRAIHHFLLHTERVGALHPFVEFVFNTPSHHRVHHGSDTQCIDKNFGGVLIIWDRLFGTFHAEARGAPTRYGVLDEARSPGLIDTIIHPWRSLARSVAAADTWAQKLATIAGPPRPKVAFPARPGV